MKPNIRPVKPVSITSQFFLQKKPAFEAPNYIGWLSMVLEANSENSLFYAKLLYLQATDQHLTHQIIWLAVHDPGSKFCRIRCHGKLLQS
jgi:hypothetical protein